ncbi:SET and MYND domain-containing protein 4-like [Anopheles merus]|uniref:SET and MYND domain-containing protein 4-like n=1 Tax=Anopheles merus TaxID=30066 RepID=UPI001BE3FA74|nr:SET and MYND domain-containing protein 4-like [Anopheles merus]XP_041784950.1 SET and MYND domain-containing protein 4-like [Anopheles merus]
MSERLQENAYDVVKLFDQLWEKSLKERIIEPTQNQPDMDKIPMIIKREIDEFLRTYPFHDRLKLQPDTKDNAKALAARNRGNELFAAEGEYLKSLQHYNESIAYSEPGSETRALAYGNRSAVCLRFDMYEECLESIRLARASNYPARLADKLNKREQHVKRCIEEMDAELSDGEPIEVGKHRSRYMGYPVLKLSYEAHANVPQLVKCVELRQDSQYGRHLVTTQKLKVGDVLLIEKPYASMLNDQERYKRCAFCHNEDRFTLIPCEGCTVTMYCSEECRDKAHRQYHRYECGVLRDCWRIVGSLLGGMVGLRTVAKAIASFDQDLEGWIDHLNTLDEAKVNAFTVDWNEVTDSDMYDTVHVLATNQKRRSCKDLAMLIFFASIVHRLLLERTELGTLCESNPARSKLLFDLLLRHVQTSLINKKQVSHMKSCEIDQEDEYEFNYFGYDSDDEEQYEERTHAIAVYPLFSMVNHSCIPNVAPIHLLDGRCAFVASRPIAAGEQLFDVYGFATMEFDRSFRLLCLEQCYNFKCRCAVCGSFSYVSVRNMNQEEEKFLRALSDSMQVEKHLPKLIEYMNEVGRRYPKHQYTAAEVMLVRSLRIIHSYSLEDDVENEFGYFGVPGLGQPL